jgi:trimethylamine---corrinoid protein Co-methyltransferase
VLDAHHSYCGTGSDVPYICDHDTRERRRARKADVESTAALCEMLSHIDFVMGMGMPEDVPRAIDDLARVEAMVRGTRKPLLVAPRDGHRLAKMKEVTTLACEANSFGIYAMSVPPLLFDEDGPSKVIACAELDIPLIWAPSPNAGTTAPPSISAVIVVANAEVLAPLQDLSEGRGDSPGSGLRQLSVQAEGLEPRLWTNGRLADAMPTRRRCTVGYGRTRLSTEPAGKRELCSTMASG